MYVQPKAKQQAAAQQPPDLGQAQIKDQAKQWLSAGQKWLSGAGKKVAQAVKETQSQINNKLDELDGRAHYSGGALFLAILQSSTCLAYIVKAEWLLRSCSAFGAQTL